MSSINRKHFGGHRNIFCGIQGVCERAPQARSITTSTRTHTNHYFYNSFFTKISQYHTSQFGKVFGLWI